MLDLYTRFRLHRTFTIGILLGNPVPPMRCIRQADGASVPRHLCGPTFSVDDIAKIEPQVDHPTLDKVALKM